MGTLGPRGAAVVCGVPFRCPAALAHEAGLIETSLSRLASCFFPAPLYHRLTQMLGGSWDKGGFFSVQAREERENGKVWKRHNYFCSVPEPGWKHCRELICTVICTILYQQSKSHIHYEKGLIVTRLHTKARCRGRNSVQAEWDLTAAFVSSASHLVSVFMKEMCFCGWCHMDLTWIP